MELTFIFLIIPFFIYWCVNEKIGLQLSIVFVVSIWVVFLYWQFNSYLDKVIPFNFNLMWVLIAVIFFCYITLRVKLETILGKTSFRTKMIIIAAASFLMILYRPSLEYIMCAGFLLGFGVGYLLNKRFAGFTSRAVLQRKGIVKILTLFARFVLGIAVITLIILRIDSFILIIKESQNIELYCFLCSALMALWVTVAGPWLFIKLRLAESDNESS